MERNEQAFYKALAEAEIAGDVARVALIAYGKASFATDTAIIDGDRVLAIELNRVARAAYDVAAATATEYTAATARANIALKAWISATDNPSGVGR